MAVVVKKMFCFNQRNSISQGHLHSEVCSYFALGQLRTKSEKVHCLFLRSANWHVTKSSLAASNRVLLDSRTPAHLHII